MDFSHSANSSPSASLLRGPSISFWQSCFAAFGAAPAIRPPPMTLHCSMFSTVANVKKAGTIWPSLGRECFSLTSARKARQVSFPPYCQSRFLFSFHHGDGELEVEGRKITEQFDGGAKPRIAIIGGGIAGVTAANAIAKQFRREFPGSESFAKIVVFEGDGIGGHRSVNFDTCEQPVWLAGESITIASASL